MSNTYAFLPLIFLSAAIMYIVLAWGYALPLDKIIDKHHKRIKEITDIDENQKVAIFVEMMAFALIVHRAKILVACLFLWFLFFVILIAKG